MNMSLSDLQKLVWTGRPDVLWFMGSQRVGHDWVTELNWLCHMSFEVTVSFVTVYCSTEGITDAFLHTWTLLINNNKQILCIVVDLFYPYCWIYFLFPVSLLSVASSYEILGLDLNCSLWVKKSKPHQTTRRSDTGFGLVSAMSQLTELINHRCTIIVNWFQFLKNYRLTNSIKMYLGQTWMCYIKYI